MNRHSFSGVHTALITPLLDNQIHFNDLERLIEDQIGSKVAGVLLLGTTGESPTLEEKERESILLAGLKVSGGRVPIMLGVGTNATEASVRSVKHADKTDVSSLLVLTPYYNKPSQEGLFKHFSKLAAHTAKPIFLYSIASRCGIEIEVDTIARLHEAHPHILGIKESSGNCDRVCAIKAKLGKDFIVLSGDDPSALPFIAVGAQGLISVASNFIPKELVKMVNYALNNDFFAAQKLHTQYHNLFKNEFIETNPVPIKYILFKSNKIHSPEVRLPLAALSKNSEKLLEETLNNLT